MAKDELQSLVALQKILAQPDKVRDLIATSLAEECIGLIKDGFRTETDPYGAKWQPKQRSDGRKTLSGKTSRLKGGWKIARRTADEITVSPSVNYAAAHQNPRERARTDNGTQGPARLKRPRRMMVPDSDLGMPPRWSRTLEEAATDGLAALLGGDGRRQSALRKMLGIDAAVGFKVG